MFRSSAREAMLKRNQEGSSASSVSSSPARQGMLDRNQSTMGYEELLQELEELEDLKKPDFVPFRELEEVKPIDDGMALVKSMIADPSYSGDEIEKAMIDLLGLCKQLTTDKRFSSPEFFESVDGLLQEVGELVAFVQEKYGEK